MARKKKSMDGNTAAAHVSYAFTEVAAGGRGEGCEVGEDDKEEKPMSEAYQVTPSVGVNIRSGPADECADIDPDAVFGEWMSMQEVGPIEGHVYRLP